MPKAQITISIMMFVWACCYFVFGYVQAIDVGFESAIKQVATWSGLAWLFTFPILLACSYMILGISTFFYKPSQANLWLVKYGPTIAAMLITVEALPTKVENINWQVLGVGTVFAMAAFLFVPWLLAILSLCFVKKAGTNAT